MTDFLKKTEAYFMKEFTEKAGRIAIFSLFLMIPEIYTKMIFSFIFITFMLASDIHNGKFSTMIALPFSYRDIFLNSYLFLIFITTITTFAGIAFYQVPNFMIWSLFIKQLIFITFYYSVSILSVTFGMDNFGIPLLVLAIDFFVGIIGGFDIPNMNPYKLFSPIFQKSLLLSGIFSIILFISAFIFFCRKGVQK
ncbi:hypothetical protein OF820_05455 [Oceanotoga sp. DSM 15011]|uniref:hypothetical protein n=1 Tax=Oceanotoga TaxID=1255275 RepID=UPI0021F441BF|nr:MULTISPECIES: hypothetical protein [Oceanotoga]MDO7976295.1 hypothetical protein [Oceanotoga teriensis]UYP01131.1 hypothetical protein OF820_05455 [Oceanotoga sp. DSM 15011]